MFSHVIDGCLSVAGSDYNVIPIGLSCITAIACKHANLRKCSLPFDWVTPMHPNKTQDILASNFDKFLEFDSNYLTKYGVTLAHFNADMATGLEEYRRRITRFNAMINGGQNLIFVFMNEYYLYFENYRNPAVEASLFKEMCEFDAFLKMQYPGLKFSILYFTFTRHEMPPGTNIVQVVTSSTTYYSTIESCPWDKFRMYCGQILCSIFNTPFEPQIVGNYQGALDTLFQS